MEESLRSCTSVKVEIPKCEYSVTSTSPVLTMLPNVQKYLYLNILKVPKVKVLIMQISLRIYWPISQSYIVYIYSVFIRPVKVEQVFNILFVVACELNTGITKVLFKC